MRSPGPTRPVGCMRGLGRGLQMTVSHPRERRASKALEIGSDGYGSRE